MLQKWSMDVLGIRSLEVIGGVMLNNKQTKKVLVSDYTWKDLMVPRVFAVAAWGWPEAPARTFRPYRRRWGCWWMSLWRERDDLLARETWSTPASHGACHASPSGCIHRYWWWTCGGGVVKKSHEMLEKPCFPFIQVWYLIEWQQMKTTTMTSSIMATEWSLRWWEEIALWSLVALVMVRYMHAFKMTRTATGMKQSRKVLARRT